LPGVIDSRAIFRTQPMFLRVLQSAGDTTTVPITVDSARLRINVLHRDTNTANLRIKIYRMPLTIDSATTFGDVAAPFVDSLVDSVNVSDLRARPPIADTVTLRIWGDTIRTDSAGNVLQISRIDGSLILHITLDTAQARFVEADSGRVGFGLRVSADSLASIAVGSQNVFDRGATLRWFYHFQGDTSVVSADAFRGTAFDTYVFDLPNPSLGDDLVVGGAPSARSLLRVTIPDFLRDTADVVRATLILVPIAPVQGAAGDSFTVLVRPVQADLGAKSPLSPATSVFGSTTIRMGNADTVRIEISDLIRAWAVDTSAATAFVLGKVPEAANFAEVRFYSSRTPAFRPALHVTYVRRFGFGEP
ncbi:MAG: hypothetical protein Q8Q14_13485, partial [Gemmatimonadales bacterium]|nr:hypothetical protein [Gemmatimonadales bacterium]